MHKVIFDTDPGVDDAMALLFLHHHPEIDLLGITTVFGNAEIDITTRNALYLKREGKIDAPVSRGAGETFIPHRVSHEPPKFIHGDDGLGNIGVPEVTDVHADPRPAHRFIVETVRANPGEGGVIMEAFKPGTGPADSYWVIGMDGATAERAREISPQASEAISSGGGGLY